MQCPSCSAPLTSGEPRCASCHALVNPPVQGAAALAPRLVTPAGRDGLGPPPEAAAAPESAGPPPLPASPHNSPRNSDEAWRREVLERVRKRRLVRTHVLPLFVESQPIPGEIEAPPPGLAAGTPLVPAPSVRMSVPDDEIIEELTDSFENVDPRPTVPVLDLLASLDAPLANAPAPVGDEVLDLALRPAELEDQGSRSRSGELSSQSLVERSRPTLVAGPLANRSLVADMPLVEPSRLDPPPAELSPRASPSTVSSRAASMNDRVQAAFIDLGMWSAMSAMAFYFASRIARTSIVGLGPAWQGLALFSVVLAAAYILFFGGLSGATPGKIACGIHVRRYDGSSLGPLASLARGCLGILSVTFLGVGIWPAFWDKDRRTLHDRATDSRVTIV